MAFFRKHGLFTILILLGLAVRILFMLEQGFSNDELSALCRTRFDSLTDLWANGVRIGDMHPAFYQTLLWFWVKVFGENEFLFRLPGLLFYLANSILIYRIASSYFSKTSGLLIVALYSGLTFTVINTVFARPYNSSTFFLLLSLFAALNIRNVSEFKWRNTVLLALGLVGTMMSHYFAFWVGIVLGISSLIYAGKGNLKYIFSAGIFSVLLFLPHLKITLFQLGVGGLQWLAPPGWNWIPDFIKLFMNDSWILAVILGLLFFGLIIFGGQRKLSREMKFTLFVFFFSFSGAFVISYVYTPILRELVMLFMLPFLLLPLMSLIEIREENKRMILTVSLSVFLISDSIFRNGLLEPVHYGVFKEIGEQINDADRELNRKNITYASNYNSVDYINYYVDQDLKEEIKEWSDQESLYRLRDRAKKARSNYFCYSFNNAYHTPMFLEVIRRYYPVEERTYLTKYSSYYLFSKNSKRQIGTPFASANTIDSDTTDMDFFGNIRLRVGDMPKGKGYKNYYLVTCNGVLYEDKPLFIVASLERNGKMATNSANEPLFYSAYDQSRIVENGRPEQFISAFELPDFAREEDEIVIYFWNPEKAKVHTENLKVYLTK